MWSPTGRKDDIFHFHLFHFQNKIKAKGPSENVWSPAYLEPTGTSKQTSQLVICFYWQQQILVNGQCFHLWTLSKGLLWERCQLSPVFSFSAFWLMILCDKVLSVKSIMTLAWQSCQTAQRSFLALALTRNNIQVSYRPLWVDVCWYGCVGTINFASCQVINSNCTIIKQARGNSWRQNSHSEITQSHRLDPALPVTGRGEEERKEREDRFEVSKSFYWPTTGTDTQQKQLPLNQKKKTTFL